MAKNEITKILSERLQKLTEEKRDIDYKLSDAKQAKQIGIDYQAFRKYLNDSAECPISSITKMAKYYKVSIDYLLGMTDNKTPNIKLKAVCDYTGLNEKAIVRISDMKNYCMDFDGTQISGTDAFEALNEYLISVVSEKVSAYVAKMKEINEDYLLHCLIQRIYKSDVNKCSESGKMPIGMACFDHKKLSDDIKKKSEKCDMSYFRASKAYESFLKQYHCDDIGEYYNIKDIYEWLHDTFGRTKEQVNEKVKEIWKEYDKEGYKQWQP